MVKHLIHYSLIVAVIGVFIGFGGIVAVATGFRTLSKILIVTAFVLTFSGTGLCFYLFYLHDLIWNETKKKNEKDTR